jgi:hypothetical protein
MIYDVTIKLTLESDNEAERVERQLDALFNCGTVRESIAEALRLGEDPHFVSAVATPGAASPRG